MRDGGCFVVRRSLPGVTEGRFFCHTSASLRWYKKTVPQSRLLRGNFPPPQSKKPSPLSHLRKPPPISKKLSPKDATHRHVAAKHRFVQQAPGSSPGVSPVGGPQPPNWSFLKGGVQGRENRNPSPGCFSPLCYFLLFCQHKRGESNIPRPPCGRTPYSLREPPPPPPFRRTPFPAGMPRPPPGLRQKRLRGADKRKIALYKSE